MALSPVTRRLGLIGLWMLALGCTDDVELLSRSPPPAPAADASMLSGGADGQAEAGRIASDGGAAGSGGIRSGGAGGATMGTGGAAPGGISGAGGDPSAGGESGSGGGPGMAGGGGVSTGGAGGSCGGICGASCGTDADCTLGSEWCEGSTCVRCHAALPTCDHGWSAAAFSRNGCTSLECAPPSACHSSAQCGSGKVCYAGVTCAQTCASGDPSCCEGNFCAALGCDGTAAPLSCAQHGCPLGQRCVGPSWTIPDCDCAQAAWTCRTAAPSSHCE